MALKMYVKINIAVLVIVLLFPCVSYANEQNALRGLNGLCVIVEDMDPKMEELGLTRDQIQTDVELRLRRAGIIVLTMEEALKSPGSPYLYVNINSYFLSTLPIVAFSTRVELRETVTLVNGMKTEGNIWHIGTVGASRTQDIRKIKEFIEEGVDKFINDYLAANPKR